MVNKDTARLAKGEEAPGCFHPAMVNGSANRQKKILASAAALVAPGGHLLYMTCTYAPEENEQVCAWLLERFPRFRAVPVPSLAAHQSPLTPPPGHQMWPQEGLGAGAFTMLFQNAETGDAGPLNEDALAPLRVITIPKEHP